VCRLQLESGAFAGRFSAEGLGERPLQSVSQTFLFQTRPSILKVVEPDLVPNSSLTYMQEGADL
jgi:hypothetical protein